MVLNTEWAQVEVIDLINDGSGLAFGIIGGRSTGVVVKTILPGGVADRDGRLQSGDHILQIGEVNLRGLGSEQVASVLRQCGVHVRLVVARPVESTSGDYQTLGSNAPIVPTKILGDPVELDRHLIENGYAETFAPPPPSTAYGTPFIYTGQPSEIQLHQISGIVDVVKDPLPIGAVPVPQANVPANPVNLLPLDMAIREPQLPETEMYNIQLKKDDLGLGITVAGYVCEKEEISGIFVKSISKGSAADLTRKIKINDRIVQVDGKSVLGCTNHEAVQILRNTGPVVTLVFERYLRGPKYEQLQQAIKANELRPPSPPSPSASSLPKVPLSAAQMGSLAIEPEGESCTSFDFDSAILLEEEPSPAEDVEIVIDGRKPGSVRFSIASRDSLHDKWKEMLGDCAQIVIAEMQKEPNSGLGISLEGTVDVENGREVRPHHYIRSILPDGPVGRNGVLQSGDELLEVNGNQLVGLNHLEVISILKQLPNFVCLVCARYPVPTRIINTAQHREAFQERNILAESLQTLIPASEKLVKAKSDTSIVSSVASEAFGSGVCSRSRSLEVVGVLPMWADEPTVIELVKGDHGLGFSILDYQDPFNPQETVIVIRSLVPGGVAQLDGHLIPGDKLLAVNDVDVEHATLDKAVQVLKSAPKGTVKLAVAKPMAPNEHSYNSQDTDQEDQTCLDDFQECIEEYQECLEVVQICIDDDASFNHSSCGSQVEDLGQDLRKNNRLSNADFLENNKNIATESEAELSYKSLNNETNDSEVILDSLNNKINNVKVKSSETNINTNNSTNFCGNRLSLARNDSSTQSEKVSSSCHSQTQITDDKDGYETCIDESLTEDVNIKPNQAEIPRKTAEDTRKIAEIETNPRLTEVETSRNDTEKIVDCDRTPTGSPVIERFSLGDVNIETGAKLVSLGDCDQSFGETSAVEKRDSEVGGAKTSLRSSRLTSGGVNSSLSTSETNKSLVCDRTAAVSIANDTVGLVSFRDGARCLGSSSVGETRLSHGDVTFCIGDTKNRLDDAGIRNKVRLSIGDAKTSLSDARLQPDDAETGIVRLSVGCVKTSLNNAGFSVGDTGLSFGVAKSSLNVARLLPDDAETSKGRFSVGDVKTSLCNAGFSIGDTRLSLGDAKSSLSDAILGIGNAKTSLSGARLSGAKFVIGDAETAFGTAMIPSFGERDTTFTVRERDYSRECGSSSRMRPEREPETPEPTRNFPNSYSEPCLASETGLISKNILLDSKLDDGLKSYDARDDSADADEFFLVHYPSDDPGKCRSEPAVLDACETGTCDAFGSGTRRLREYYNDYEDCLEAYRVYAEKEGREFSDDEIFGEILLPFKSASAPDVTEEDCERLTCDLGVDKGRRKSAFVAGYQTADCESEGLSMTIIRPIEDDVVAGINSGVMLDKHWGSTHNVQVYREPNAGLGISLVGGKVDMCPNDPSEAVMGIFVKNVVENSPAGRTGKFRTGDRIVAVSGTDLTNLSHEKAVEVIRNAPNPVTFVIQSLMPWDPVPKETPLKCEKLQDSNKIENYARTKTKDEPKVPKFDSKPTIKECEEAELQIEKKEESTECLVHAEDNHVPDEAAGKEENHSKQYSDSPESSDESDEEDVRDLEGRTVSAKGVEIERASAGNLKRSKEEIEADKEEEDDFGYTTNKVKKKYANLGHSILMVQLERGGQGLGLSLAGHKDRNCMAVFVCGLNPKGAAYRTGGIQVGDEILEVNGVVLHGRCHLNASAIIKGLSGPVFKVIILRRKTAIDDIAVKPITQFPVSLAEEASEEQFSNYPNVRTITVKKGTQSLGIMIIEGKHAEVGQGIFISDIQEGSSAEKAGLEIGEMILAVNKDSLLGSNYETAANLLKRTEGLVTLVVSNPSKRATTPLPEGDKISLDKSAGLKPSAPPSRASTPVPEVPTDPATCPIIPGKTTPIEITTDNKGLGVFFVGGKDTLIPTAIILLEIYVGGPADKDGRLQEGDHVLEINGTCLKDITYTMAAQALRQTLPKVKMTVFRPEQIEYTTVEVELMKKSGKGLGLSIMARKSGKGVYISDIVSGSAADIDGKIMRGDILVSVNGQDLQNASGEEACAVMKTAMGKVALKLNRFKPVAR